MAELAKGILVIIEGIDGVGKTTQARLLAEFLRGKGYKVMELGEPTRGFWGQKIRALTKKGRNVTPQEECQWFINDRIEDVKKNIKPALEAKSVVIMDRYYHSNMAYQGALGLDMDRIREENEAFAPVPDLVIILDAEPITGLDRIRNKRREVLNHFETLEYQKKVRKNFLDMKKFSYVRIVDASGESDAVQDEIRRILLGYLKNV